MERLGDRARVGPRVDDLPSILAAYNVTTLNVMAELLRLGGEALNKRGLIDKLSRFLGSPRHLASVRGRLTTHQWQTLAYHRLRSESVPLSSLLVRLMAGGASEREALADLLALLTSGCLVFVEQPEYNYKIGLALDRLAEGDYLDLRVAGFPRLLEEAEKRAGDVEAFGWAAPEPRVVRAGSYRDFQRECYLALRAASDEEIKLTNRGMPFKAALARLAATAGGITIGRGAKTKLSDVPIPPRLWLVLAALRAAGLFGGDDDPENLLRLKTVPGAASLLSKPVAEQARRLFDAWVNSVYNELARVPSLHFEGRLDPAAPWAGEGAYQTADLPTSARLADARRSIVRTIRAGARGRPSSWLLLSALQAAIRADDPELLIPIRPQPYGYGYGRRPRFYEGIYRPGRSFPDNRLRRDVDWLEVEGAYVAAVVAEPLHWLGLVDLGDEGDGKPVAFRLTPLGRHVFLDEPFDEEAVPAGGPRLIVQPSFEVVVLDVAADLGLVARLDDFAERASLDRAATYRLTREASVRGFDRGHTVQGMIDLLESASGSCLPQNVRFSLEEWSRLYERVHVRRAAMLLVADYPQQLDDWLADEELIGWLEARLSPTVALVRGDRRQELARRLAKRDPSFRAHDYAMPFRRRFRVPEPTIVQPLPEADEPYLRYRLGRFAVPENGRFRLTSESVKGATERGLSAEGIISYLQTVADGRVPDDTCLRIRGWGGMYRPLRHAEAVVVELPPGLTVADLKRVREIRQALLPPIGGNVIALDPSGFEAARAALAERGLSLEAGLTSAPEAASSGKEAVRSKRGGSARIPLRVLPPPQLRRYVEEAIAEGRWLVFGLVDEGKRQAVLLLPLRIFGQDGVTYVQCRVDDPVEESEIHDIPLQLVDAVGDAVELGLV